MELKREALVNILKSNLNIETIYVKELLENIKLELSKYIYNEDKNFLMNARRKYLLSIINKRIINNEEDKDQIIKDLLYDLFEFVCDDYGGNSLSICQEFDIKIEEFDNMDIEYRRKGIICLEEKEAILEIINNIENYIKKE